MGRVQSQSNPRIGSRGAGRSIIGSSPNAGKSKTKVGFRINQSIVDRNLGYGTRYSKVCNRRGGCIRTCQKVGSKPGVHAVLNDERRNPPLRRFSDSAEPSYARAAEKAAKGNRTQNAAPLPKEGRWAHLFPRRPVAFVPQPREASPSGPARPEKPAMAPTIANEVEFTEETLSEALSRSQNVTLLVRAMGEYPGPKGSGINLPRLLRAVKSGKFPTPFLEKT